MHTLVHGFIGFPNTYLKEQDYSFCESKYLTPTFKTLLKAASLLKVSESAAVIRLYPRDPVRSQFI